MKGVLALALLILTAVAASAQSTPPPEDPVAQTIISKSKAVVQALKSKDTATLKALVADDVRVVSSAGHVYGKGELLGAAQEGGLRTFQFYGAEVIPIDRDSAIVTFNLIVDMPEGDDDLAPRYQKISDLWIRQGDDWRLKFEQATPLRPID